MKITKENVNELIKEAQLIGKQFNFSDDEIKEAENTVTILENLTFDLESFRLGLLFGGAEVATENEEYLILIVNTITKKLENK